MFLAQPSGKMFLYRAQLMHNCFQISSIILALLKMCVCSICSFVSYLSHTTTLMFPRQPIYCIIFCFFCIHLVVVCAPQHVSLCQESRWTVHPLCRCHSYYLQECDTSVPRGMGTKEEPCHPPRPPISMSGQHLSHLQPAAA